MDEATKFGFTQRYKLPMTRDIKNTIAISRLDLAVPFDMLSEGRTSAYLSRGRG